MESRLFIIVDYEHCLLYLSVRYTQFLDHRTFIYRLLLLTATENRDSQGLFKVTFPAYHSVIRTASRDQRVRNPSCEVSRAPRKRTQLKRWTTESSTRDVAIVTAAADCQKAVSFSSEYVLAEQGVMAVTHFQAPAQSG